MPIKIGNLTTAERREDKVTLTYDEDGAVMEQEIRISFRKPTEEVWRQVSAIENAEDATNRDVRAEQLVACDVQSPDILNEDGTVRQLTLNDFRALDITNLTTLFTKVRSHFFLRTPTPTQETNTSSTSLQATAA